jgi:hypothetical protein
VNPPTLAGFLSFIRNVMGISTTVLPDASSVITMAFNVAIAIVNINLQIIPVGPQPGDTIYSLAVYNLAGSNLLNYAQDLPGAAVVPGSGDPGLPYFEYTRQKYNINGFVSGVVQSSSDEGTSVSMVVQEAAQTFTLQDLQQLKDPYGRRFLSFAQQAGTLWGIN